MSVSKQKREAIAALLQENPQRSDRAIAKQAKISHHTVAKVRTEMEATRGTGQSAQSTVPIGRVGLDGKVRKVSPGKVKAEIEANGEFPHKDHGRTETSGHKARGRKPKPPAGVRDARSDFIRTPREPEASCALAESDLWDVIAPALPEELFDRIDRHIEALLAELGEQGS
jgi:hypothetical protein